MRNRKLHYAWIILLGVILIRGFAGGGINLTSGLFLSPVSQDIGVGIGTLSLYLSITSIVTVLWLPLAGKFVIKYDIRIIAIIGAILQALSFVAFGFLNSVFGWYVLSIPFAMGSVFLVSLLGPILINRWFAKNQGLIMGIHMAFVGLFGAILQPVTSTIISQRGWRYGYYIIGGVTFIIVIVASLLFLRNKPEDKNLSPFGTDSSSENKVVSNQVENTANISEKTAIRSASFYLLVLFMVAITGVGVFMQHIPTYGSLLGYSVKQTGNALAYASIGTAIGSIAIGIISDKIGSIKTSYIMIGIGVLSIFGFFMSSYSFFLFGLSTFLHGLVSSSIMVLAPILTIKFYGQKDYEKIFAKVSMGAPIASVLLIPIYGFIYDATKSYQIVLVGMVCLLIIAALSITIGWKKRCVGVK